VTGYPFGVSNREFVQWTSSLVFAVKLVMFDNPRASKRRKTIHEVSVEDVDIHVPRKTRNNGTTPRSTRKNGETANSVATTKHDEDELGDQVPPYGNNTTTVITPASKAPRRRKQDAPLKSEEEEDVVVKDVHKSVERPGLRSSGRQRRPPRRFSPEPRISTPRASTARRTATVEPEDKVQTPLSTTRRRLRYDLSNRDGRVASQSPSRSTRRHNNVVEETPEAEVEKEIATEIVEEDTLALPDEMDIDEIDEAPLMEDVMHETLFEDALSTQFVEAPIPTPKMQSDDANHIASVEDTPDISFLKSVVLGRLTGRRPMRLIDLEDEHKKVHHLLEQTVVAGEGNSMLVIGARGTGKTALVNTIIRDLAREHQDTFHVIRLNGFIHTDDKLALREIWRQLGREMDIEEEETGQIKNYADTLATLLALLSHPAEQGPAIEGNAQTTSEIAKSVIFVMDEFDLFATHARQTLLYNLFDIAQARKAPIAVLGLTTRVDAAESLEKRVKSRFSHRYVHLSLPKNMPALTSICKAALHVEYEGLDFDERTRLAKLSTRTVSTPAKRGTPASNKKSNYMDTLAAWNATIGNLFTSPTTIAMLTDLYRTSKSASSALTSFLLPITLLQVSTTPTTTTPRKTTQQPQPLAPITLLPPDSKLIHLPTLPTLPLTLLIAAARLSIILDTPLTNFNMTYAEYLAIAQRARIAGLNTAATGRVWGREVAREGWEVLIERRLLVPAIGNAGAAGGQAARGNEMWRVDVALEEIEGAVLGGGGAGGLGRVVVEEGLLRWCREI